MSESQASPTPKRNLLKSKKYWRNMALVLAVTVVITIVATSQLVNLTQTNYVVQSTGYSPGKYSWTVLAGQIALNTQGMYLTGFNVPEDAKTALLQGNYTVVKNGAVGNATVTIWSQQEFLNYFGEKSAVPCYNVDLLPHESDSLNVTLTKGNYIILVGGVKSAAEVLNAQLYLNFTV